MRRWTFGGVVLSVVLGGVVLPTAGAGATGETTPTVQAAPVPVLCRQTGARVPSTSTTTASVTGPDRVGRGDTLVLQAVTAHPFPPGPPTTLTSRVAVSQGDAASVVPLDGWGPTDLTVPVAAPAGTLVALRLLSYSSSTPVPELGIDFVDSCAPPGPGTVARWVVGGYACDAASGTGAYLGGLTATDRAVPSVSLRLDASGCDVPGASTLQLRAYIPTLGFVNCQTGLYARGIGSAVPGRGRVLWPDGTVSRLTLTASGTGDAFGLELEGRIARGPHRGHAIGATVTLAPRTVCGSTYATRITTMDATTARLVL